MLEVIGQEVAYVSFNFGSFAYVGVTLYKGKTFEECLKLRSKDIDGYIKDGRYIKIA